MTPQRRHVTWLLVGALFFLRVVLAGGFLAFLRLPRGRVVTVYELGTYTLTAVLIWWEREALHDFHMDPLALAVFLLGKPYEYYLHTHSIPFSYGPWGREYLLYLVVPGALALSLLLSHSGPPRFQARTLAWVLVAAASGAVYGVITGQLIKLQTPGLAPQRLPLKGLIFLPTQQLVYAGIPEEPFFRGFLWGSLRRAGWRDAWIWLFQTLLFALAHVYYARTYPISFWVIVPCSALLFGWLAWRSRSAGVSMVAHGLTNGIGQIAAFYRLG